MNFEIVEEANLSGPCAKIYSILPLGAKQTLFEQFLLAHRQEHAIEVSSIVQRIFQIGHETGMREGYFKHEGNRAFVKRFGQCVFALYDEPDKLLRLYCMKFGGVALILGGGALKPKEIRKWQESEELSSLVNQMMALTEQIILRMDERELLWSIKLETFVGDLIFISDEKDE